MNQLKRIETQKIALILNFIMLGICASQLPLKEDSSCKTFYTDGAVIGYNPDFVNSITDYEVLFILAHEVLHVVLGHPFRTKNLNWEIWPKACDYVVNALLVEMGFQMLSHGLYEAKYHGMSAEEVYYLLMKGEDEKQKQSSSTQKQSDQSNSKGGEPDKNGEPDADGEDDCVKPYGELRPCPVEGAKEEWSQKAQAAAAQAKRRGTLADSIHRKIIAANAPQIDFVSLSYLFLHKITQSNYQWKKLNQRYLHQGLLAPSLTSTQLGNMYFGNDTSGSVGDFQQACCQQLLRDLMNDCRPESLTVIHCDAKVQGVERYETFDHICIKPIGGGGTDFRPVFEEIEKLDDNPAGLIFLTDMEGTFPDKEPDYPVLWISTTRDKNAPFGETIFLDLRK